MSHVERSRDRSLMHGTLAALGLLAAGAIAVTWSWNTIVPDLTGLARLRFAEGLSLACLALVSGALFGTGQRLAGTFERRR